MSEDTLAGKVRMQLALAQTPVGRSPRGQVFLEWLEFMLGYRAHGGDVQSLGVSFTADLSRMSWWLSRGGHALLERHLLLFKQNGLPETESARLVEICREFPSSRLGAWLACEVDTQEAGWFLHGDFSLQEILIHIPPSAEAALLSDWAKRHRIIRCPLLARPAGAVGDYYRLHVPLPGDTVQAQMAAGLALFDAYGIPELPHPALAALLNADALPLELTVAISTAGVHHLGILGRQVNTERTIQLCRATGMTDLEDVAGVRGALGAPELAPAEGAQTGAGFQTYLHLPVI